MKLVYHPRTALAALAVLVVVLYECGNFYASVSQEEFSPSASRLLEEPFQATNELQSLPVQKDFSPASPDNQKERIKEVPAAGSSSSTSQRPKQNFSAADVDDIKKSTKNEALKFIPIAPTVELDSKTKGGEADQPSRTAMGEGKPSVNTAPIATIKSDSQAKDDEADQSPKPTMGEGNATKTSFIAESRHTAKSAKDASVSRLENTSAIVLVEKHRKPKGGDADRSRGQAMGEGNATESTKNFFTAESSNSTQGAKDASLSRSENTAAMATVKSDSKRKGGAADLYPEPATGDSNHSDESVNGAESSKLAAVSRSGDIAAIAAVESARKRKGGEADLSPGPATGEGNVLEITKKSTVAESVHNSDNTKNAAVSRVEDTAAIATVESANADRSPETARGEGKPTERETTKQSSTAESSNVMAPTMDAAVSRSENTAAIKTAELDSKTKGGARHQASEPLWANSTFEYICRAQRTKVHFPAELLSRVTEHGSLSLIIESHDVAGNLRTDCSDYFVANITGPAIYSPPVVCGSDGRHVIRLGLIESGTYRLVIQALGAVGKSKGHDTCFPVDPHAYVIGPETTSACPAFEFEYKPNTAFANPNAAQRTSCNPKNFYSGRFVKIPTNLPVGGQQNVTWKPFSNCDWPAYWAPERLKRCLAGKWILIVGDSTTHEIACGLMRDLYGGFDPSWSPSYGVCKKDRTITSWSCPRIFDTGHIDPTKPRITHYWTGHRKTCLNCGGLGTVLGDKKSLQRILDLQGPEGHRTQADLLVFNSGLHDLCHEGPEGNLRKFRQYLGEMMTFLKPLAKQAVWKPINPKLANRTCDDYFGHAARVPWMNEQALEVARTHGFQIADSYPMLLSATVGNDGRHCRQGPSCKTFGASLLNYLCAP